jgi:hypothetical protein
MQTRTRHSIARFLNPFTLTGLDHSQPVGEYNIDEDERSVEGMSWVAWQRVATIIHLPARRDGVGSRQMVKIDHAELEAALKQDRQYSAAPDDETG